MKRSKVLSGALLSSLGVSCLGNGVVSAKKVELDEKTLKNAERDFRAVMDLVSKLSSASEHLTPEQMSECVSTAKSLQNAADLARSEYLRNSALSDKVEVNKSINKFRDAMPPIVAECERRLKVREMDEQVAIAGGQRRLRESTAEVRQSISDFIANHDASGLSDEAAADILDQAKDLARTIDGAPTLPEVEAAKVKLKKLVEDYNGKLAMEMEARGKKLEEEVKQFKRDNKEVMDDALKRVKSLKKDGDGRAQAQEEYDKLSALLSSVSSAEDFSAFNSAVSDFNRLLDDLNASEEREAEKLRAANAQANAISDRDSMLTTAAQLRTNRIELGDVVVGNNVAVQKISTTLDMWLKGLKVNPATILYGPPGSGKTSGAIFIAASKGIETVMHKATDMFADADAGTRKLLDTVKKLQSEGKSRNKYYQVLLDDADGVLSSKFSHRKAVTAALDYINVIPPADVHVRLVLTCNDLGGIAGELKRGRRAGEIVYVGLLEYNDVKELLEKRLSYYDLAGKIDINYFVDRLYGHSAQAVVETVNGAALLAQADPDRDPNARICLTEDQLKWSLEDVLERERQANEDEGMLS